MENETKATATPKNLTNNKQNEVSKESPDQIVDESKDIEDFYDEQGLEEQKKSLEKGQKANDVGAENEELDMDYSHTHLEEFLKSNNGGNHAASGQQLLNSFMSTYNKTKGGAQAAKAGEKKPPIGEDIDNIPERDEEDDDIEDEVDPPKVPSFEALDVTNKQGFKQLLKFQMRIFD